MFRLHIISVGPIWTVFWQLTFIGVFMFSIAATTCYQVGKLNESVVPKAFLAQPPYEYFNQIPPHLESWSLTPPPPSPPPTCPSGGCMYTLIVSECFPSFFLHKVLNILLRMACFINVVRCWTIYMPLRALALHSSCLCSWFC